MIPQHWGVEVEIQGITRSYLNLLQTMGVLGSGWEVHDDGSCRVPTYSIDGIPFLPQYQDDSLAYPLLPAGAQGEGSIGFELVSPPLLLEDMKYALHKLRGIFSGTLALPRSSIHFHASAADVSWTEWQRLCRWFYYLESPLYRCSAGGIEHRGQVAYVDPRTGDNRVHDHNYARPLSDSIGIHTESGRIAHLVNIGDLLSAKTASTFLAAWGRMDTIWGRGFSTRWHPWRLMGINLSRINQGTVEWRIFNPTYRHLPIFLDIVEAMQTLAGSGIDPDFDAMPLGRSPYSEDEEYRIISDVLGLDLYTVWGDIPVRACRKAARLSHYDNSTFILPSRTIQRVINNAGVKDDYTPDYPLYQSMTDSYIPVDTQEDIDERRRFAERQARIEAEREEMRIRLEERHRRFEEEIANARVVESPFSFTYGNGNVDAEDEVIRELLEDETPEPSPPAPTLQVNVFRQSRTPRTPRGRRTS